MKKGRVVAFLIALVALVSILIYGSMNSVQAQCELCVEYNGRTECRSGSGADDAEAMRAAQKAACAVMATGMAESVNCQNVQPTNVQCGQ
jgi:hypothetical protein